VSAPPLRIRIGLLILVLAVAGVALASRFRRDPGAVRASGVVEMDEVDVASRVGGRVVRLAVDEGDTVRVGDTLAVLGQDEVAEGYLAQRAEAERLAAQALEVRRGPRKEQIQVARAELDAATSAYEQTVRDYERIDALFREQVVSQADFDRARTTRDAAAARRAAAAEELALMEEGNRREQVLAAQRAAEAADAQARGALSRLSELVLVAPAKGVVLLRNFEPGELVQAGTPVVTLGNPDSLWMRVYVAAPRIEEVRLGATVEVRLEGISKNVYTGRVVEIANRAEFTPRAALTEEERANLVFAVKIALDPSGGALKAGMPADARIHTPRDRRGD
jgi:HlyD family secretion protein